MITKIHAHIAAAYDYKLVDKEGNIYIITAVYPEDISIWLSEECFFDISFSQIGTEYFFLCRPLSDLVKEIETGIIPLVELAKIAFPKSKPYIDEVGNCILGRYCFGFNKHNLSFWNQYNDGLFDKVPNQLALFQKLYEMHFDLFPEGTTKPITI